MQSVKHFVDHEYHEAAALTHYQYTTLWDLLSNLRATCL
jgi:hypothetical protein